MLIQLISLFCILISPFNLVVEMLLICEQCKVQKEDNIPHKQIIIGSEEMQKYRHNCYFFIMKREMICYFFVDNRKKFLPI